MSRLRESKCHFDLIKFICEACRKLEASSMTAATASCIYHRFQEETTSYDYYDLQLVAAVSIYLAGKVEEDHLKIRDVINVCHRMINPGAEPLELDVEYFDLRDTFIHLELLILRMLRFQVNFSHPHKYLLHYIWSLSHWVGKEIWSEVPVLQSAWAFIQDFLHDPVYLAFKPQHLAVGAIYLAFQVYGIKVPYEEEAAVPWYEALVDDLNEDKVWEVVTAIIRNYKRETEIRS